MTPFEITDLFKDRKWVNGKSLKVPINQRCASESIVEFILQIHKYLFIGPIYNTK